MKVPVFKWIPICITLGLAQCILMPVDSYSKNIYFHLLFSLSKGHDKSNRGSPPRTRVLKLCEKKNNFTSLSWTILFSQIPAGITVDSNSVNRKFTVSLQTLDTKKLQPVPKYKMEITSRLPFLPQVRRSLPSFAQVLRLSRLMEFIKGSGCGFMGIAHPQKLGLIGTGKVKKKGTELSFRVQHKGVLWHHSRHHLKWVFSCPAYSLLCFIVLNKKKI